MKEDLCIKVEARSDSVTPLQSAERRTMLKELLAETRILLKLRTIVRSSDDF